VSPRGNTRAPTPQPGNDPPVLRTADLDYHLPDELVATHPAEPRDAARLMVVRRSGGDGGGAEGAAGPIEHTVVSELPRFLTRGDLLVVNTTRVLPARFVGLRRDTGGGVEGLYLADAPAAGGGSGPLRWVAMLKAGNVRPGMVFDLARPGEATGVAVRAVERTSTLKGDPDDGAWVVEVEGAGPGTRSADVLARVGLTPLPPYIRSARKRRGEAVPDATDQRDYQTAYAHGDAASPVGHGPTAGSVAAPTAGLHFTPALLDRLAHEGVERREVVLHVGAGTFKPVETELVEQHPIHAEWCAVPPETAAAVAARLGGAGAAGAPAAGRVIAVGTTTARTLESFASLVGPGPFEHATRLLIAPGRPFRHVHGLLTNFHLPRSSLMALVAALFPEGAPRLLALYREAVERHYRFYSYGDAMLILP
jgi:S-adenosylmethionine:tRNA ribosyltransferase-isomerase